MTGSTVHSIEVACTIADISILVLVCLQCITHHQYIVLQEYLRVKCSLSYLIKSWCYGLEIFCVWVVSLHHLHRQIGLILSIWYLLNVLLFYYGIVHSYLSFVYLVTLNIFFMHVKPGFHLYFMKLWWFHLWLPVCFPLSCLHWRFFFSCCCFLFFKRWFFPSFCWQGEWKDNGSMWY